MTVYLPKVLDEGSALRVKRFDTDLPLFPHAVGDIGDGVEFGEIALKTADGPIWAEVSGIFPVHVWLLISLQSLYAIKASIVTSNAPVGGNFNASEFLELTTTNANIDANIGLSNDEAQGVTDLIIKTSNASVVSFLLLHEKAQSSFTQQPHSSNRLSCLCHNVRSTTHKWKIQSLYGNHISATGPQLTL